MFRKSLQEKLKGIFGFEKTTFDAPSDVFEQDTLFIEINQPRTRTSEGVVYARVEGQLVVYSQDNKLTYGFFNKRIELAEYSLKKDFFFYDIDANIENSPARLQNITERRVSFVFFFKAQFDPRLGELTSLETEEV
jgi:hypothetical protein